MLKKLWEVRYTFERSTVAAVVRYRIKTVARTPVKQIESSAGAIAW